MRDRLWQGIIIRLISSLFVVVFLALLYWSSLLQEERLRAIQADTSEIKEEIASIQIQLAEKSFREPEESAKETPLPKREMLTARPYIDPSLPNLLIEDPYFKETLPKLLGKNFRPHGVLRMASIGKAEDLHPFTLWAHVSEWMSYCQKGAGTSQFGKYQVLTTDLAIKIEERKTDRPDMMAYWVHLRDNVMWQPLDPAHFSKEIQLAPHFLKKHKVTAYDFQFYLQALKNTHVDLPAAVVSRTQLRDIDKIEVLDDLTFVVYYKLTKATDKDNKTIYRLPYRAKLLVSALTPLARFVYQYRSDGTKICPDDTEPNFYEISSLWAQNFVNHFAKRVIVSCGSWLFDGATDRQIRFRRNPDHYRVNEALYNSVEIYFVENTDAIWRDFMAQKIDLCQLAPQNLVELKRFLESPFYEKEKAKGHEVKRIDYLARVFTYIGWNEKRPYFESKKVRQALAQAIDYKRLIQQNLNGQAVEITGPFFCLSASYDKSLPPWPYDPDNSRRLLAEDGWVDSTGSGYLDKVIDGKRTPFRFSITYYVKNAISKANVELIATLLREIGIDCRVNGVDVADLSAQCDDKSFDALYLSWQLSSPPEDPEQIWSSRGANEKGSSNLIGFSNPEADKLIEELKFESDLKKREVLYHRLHALIYDEAPYAFLYTPYVNLVYWNWLDGMFVPRERQDLIPGADVEQPYIINTWKKET
jgi:peptide/nickel transport system substrate-binding protein